MNEYWIGAFLLGRKNKGEKNGSNKEKKEEEEEFMGLFSLVYKPI